MNSKKIEFILALALMILPSAIVSAQTTAFSYQGLLNDGGTPASGAFQMQFKLFDSVGGVGQIGSTITDVPVTASGGIFSVKLDFGSNALTGENRWLEIAVRHNSGESYTTLSPREQIASSPYSVRTLSAASADNALSLGGVAASQYLQTNGNGSGLTNLNAGSVSTGTLSNARLGQIPTANIADSAVTAPKIAPGQAVKSVNTLKDDVTIAAGTNITVTPAGNTLTIASLSGGVGGSGTTSTIPAWSGGTTLGNSVITQNANGVQLPNGVQLAANPIHGNQMSFGSPNGETGITMAGANGRADLRFDGTTLRLVSGPAGTPPANGIAVSATGGALITGTNSTGAVVTARRATGDAYIVIDSTTVAQSSVLSFRKNNLNRWLMFADATAETGSNAGSDFRLDQYSDAGNGIAGAMFVKRATGNVGFGTITPQTRLALGAGPTWTSNSWLGSLSMPNASAIGWEANASGQRFGIGQSTGGLYFFRTTSGFGTTGTPADYAMTITDTGNVVQARSSGGLVKAMLHVNSNGTIIGCYNGITNSSTGNCGFSVFHYANGKYEINFGFKVDDRFYSVTARSIGGDFNAGANYYSYSANTVNVYTFDTDEPESWYDYGFMIIVY